ncbi:MAG TPA: hypothetical protein VGJ91_02360, partial [Polyangiaceae bacterium]
VGDGVLEPAPALWAPLEPPDPQARRKPDAEASSIEKAAELRNGFLLWDESGLWLAAGRDNCSL